MVGNYQSTIVFCLFLPILLVNAQESTTEDSSKEDLKEPPIDISALFRISYFVRDNATLDLAAKFVNEAHNHNITLKDVIEVTKMDTYSFTFINGLLERFDIHPEEFITVESLESAFNALNISILSIYKELVTKGFVPDAKKNVPEILDVLGIDQAEFNNIILYGSDADLFKLLKSSNITGEGVKSAFNIIGKTPSDFYDFIRPSIFAQIKLYSLDTLLYQLHQFDIGEKQLKDVLEAFEVAPNDLYGVESFRAAFEQFVDEINKEYTIGVLYSNSEVATANSVLKKIGEYQYSIGVSAAAVDTSTTYPVSEFKLFDDQCSFTPLILNVGALSGRNPAVVADSYNTTHLLGNCKYITTDGSLLLVEEVTSAHNHKVDLKVELSNIELYKVGSPLFCDDKLFGLAEERKDNSVGFRTFYCDPDNSGHTTIFPSSDSTVLHYSKITLFTGLSVLFLGSTIFNSLIFM